MFTIWFSWPAWSWVNTAGLVVANYLNNLWYKVYWDKEYQSIIKWWNNTFVLYVDEKDLFLTKNIDVFFVYDDFAILRNKQVYNIKNVIKIDKQKDFIQNMISIWSTFKILRVSIDNAILYLKKYFSNKKLSKEVLDKNINSLKKWYDLKIPAIYKIKNLNNDYMFEDWNKMIAKWALDGWLEFYSAYPMTPASSLIKYLSKKITFFQWEDEIAVWMSMLWARFAGKRAMCWTSWWWFALMSEWISFANQTEIGWIYVLSQRWWPSTWTPTFTEQWDILFACNASFWDTKPIVVSPNTFENWYLLMKKVLDRWDIYQHPIVVLIDKQFSESYSSIKLSKFNNLKSSLDIKKIKFDQNNKEIFDKYEDLKNNKFLRYTITKNWISAYTYPWVKNWEFIASSYEHTESWFSTEDPEIKKVMTEKRHKKIETFIKNEFNNSFFWFEVVNPNANNFIVTQWINHIVTKKFVENNKSWWLITITVIQPLDTRLKKYLLKAEKIVFVELNKSWQLQEIVTSKLWLNCEKYDWKISYLRKYNNYPLFIEDLEEKLL